jgi:UDP-glucose 4-epimerase
MNPNPKSVLLTGAGGFIGSHVCRRLLSENIHVYAVDNFSTGFRHNVPEGCELFEFDIADSSKVAQLPTDFDIILHLAGQSSGEISFDDPITDLEKNTCSTINLIQHGIRSGARRIVYASSMSVYGDQPDQPTREDSHCAPLSCYGVGKLAAENYLKIFSPRLPFVALRMFNVYGPGQNLANLRQGMVSIFVAQALKKGAVHVKGGVDRYRDFIEVNDVVEAWYNIACSDCADNQFLNLGTGRRTTVRDLLNIINGLLPDMTWYSRDTTLGDQLGIFASTSKLKSILGIDKFTDLETGLGKFLEWARNEDNAGAKGTIL